MMQNKNVLLCGAANGLGRKIGEKFSEAGWNPIIMDLVVGEDPHGKFHFYQCDLSHFQETEKCVDQIFDRFHQIDALVNCVRYRKKTTPPINYAMEWSHSIAVGLHTYFHTCSLVCEKMKNKGSGCSIINISSVLANIVTLNESIGYHAAKSAINQMTRYLAVQYGQYNIRANTVSPGLISNQGIEKTTDSPQASLYAKLARFVPLRRSGSPEEVADLILFLASSHSSFITGQDMVIDGGLQICEQLATYTSS